MEQFGISIRCSAQPEAFQLKDRIERKLNLSKRKHPIHLTVDTAQIKAQFNDGFNIESSSDCRIEALRAIALAIAEWIADEKEVELLDQILRHDYHYYDPLELKQIHQYCLELITDAGQYAEASKRRSLKIVDAVMHCLTEHTDLHVEGMIRFRLQSYKDELREMVEYAVDEYVMDKQYQEFITLLKYFVFVQEAKMESVHLIHQGDYMFRLLDEHLRPIETKQMEGVVLEMLDQDLNYEDMIVSTLITVSPQTIILHTQEGEMQVIRTIRQIFENRTILCTSCHVCNTSLDIGPPQHERPHHHV